MGYQTVMRVPRIRTYEEALKKYNNTKRIRGRENIVPLGERRDCDTYSIRKNVWTDAMELVLYQTPVIKFTVEDEVSINFGRWSSASTCQFISRVLGVAANRVRGDVVLSFHNGTKAMIADNETLTLVRTDGRWVPKQAQVLYDYRIDRKGANEVRKSVSQFKDYLRGVLKLKAEEITTNFGPSFQMQRNVVKLSYADLVEVFGKDVNPNNNNFRPAVSEWVKLDEKPTWTSPESKARMWDAYRDRTTKFYELIRNDQDDNTRHQNYWIAFNILFAQGNNLYWRDSMDAWVTLGVEEFEKSLDKALFSMFSAKVFKKVALPEGRVPTGKYNDYAITEED